MNRLADQLLLLGWRSDPSTDPGSDQRALSYGSGAQQMDVGFWATGHEVIATAGLSEDESCSA